MLRNRLFYLFKPIIPRQLQILVRRKLVTRKRLSCGDIWPIDERAGKLPEGWAGWPEQKKFALVLIHDVDTLIGHEKCYQLMKLEEEMGFRSSFNFVPERYKVSKNLRNDLISRGFEVGVHGLKHDGKLFSSRRIFKKRAVRINEYLKEWDTKGLSSPSMHHNLNWMHELNIKYSISTFDTDPFEPQPDAACTILPFVVKSDSRENGYVEIPYTLCQDFTLYIIMQEKSIKIWKKKLDWIAEKGGMALLNTHPDYMSFNKNKINSEEYPSEYYKEFLEYVIDKYTGQYWPALPKDMASFWKNHMLNHNPHV